ncbi:COPZ1 isoform 12 [Pan troglodytes]|uniref:Coatomer subunit zeta n=3 Tax=Hominidae TaxID=9604 RepID=F8VUC5_HUMAN|nr:COPI coat complex subunit zeta 1 [Homo sapiens]KAI4066340.1 COPI coat complex subunit zeta 1 [Homo sapiens]PNI89908.1 COPZ1 isoform 12 [Pan troglodytes]PNJ45047.1 COPZ1 isoform 3 [Pongo abelii]
MEALILEPSLYTVKAILILDNDGDRLFAKYYDDTYPSVKEQKAFEKNIFNKTHRTDTDAYGCSELSLRLIEPDAEEKCRKASTAGEHGGAVLGCG